MGGRGAAAGARSPRVQSSHVMSRAAARAGEETAGLALPDGMERGVVSRPHACQVHVLNLLPVPSEHFVECTLKTALCSSLGRT